jgi:hypothetical protein
MSNLQAIYTKAAGLIAERGFIRNAYRGSRGQLCLAGAMRVAQGLDADPRGYRPLSDYTPAEAFFCREIVGEGYGGVESFNNEFVNNEREAVAVLELAADLAA